MRLLQYCGRGKSNFGGRALSRLLAASFVFFFLKGMLWLALLGMAFLKLT